MIDFVREAYLNGLISYFKQILLSDEELEKIRSASSMKDILKVLNRSKAYFKLSTKLVNDCEKNELLFFSHLIKDINLFKKFSSKRIKKLLTLLYDAFLSYYNNVAQLKDLPPLFNINYISTSTDKSSFNENLQILFLELNEFNEQEKAAIKKFLDYKLGNSNYSIITEINIVSELLNYLYKREEELKQILKAIRRVSW